MAFTPRTEFGKILVANLRANTVTKDKIIFNTDYRGDASFGQVMIPVVGEKSTSDYNKSNIGANTVTYQSNAWIPAVLDKDKYINEYYDKVNSHQVPYDDITSGLEKNGYALAVAEDTDALDTLVKGIQGKGRNGQAYPAGDPRNGKKGTVISKAAANFESDDIYVTIVEIKKTLDKAHVPAAGRYLIVNSEVAAKILLSDKALKAGQLNDAVVQNGVMARIAGFDVFESELMGSVGSDPVGIIAGHSLFATRVDWVVAEPYLVDGSGTTEIVGGSLMKGRMIFTHEVTRPEAFAMLTYKTA